MLFLIYRKALLLTTGIIVAGGTAAAYMLSRRTYKGHDSMQYNGVDDGVIEPNKKIGKGNNVKKSRQKKGGLKSVKVLAAILLSRMGRMGTRDLFALVATVVRFFTQSIYFIYNLKHICYCSTAPRI